MTANRLGPTEHRALFRLIRETPNKSLHFLTAFLAFLMSGNASATASINQTGYCEARGYLNGATGFEFCDIYNGIENKTNFAAISTNNIKTAQQITLINSAWRQNQDTYPEIPFAYAIYETRGKYGNIGVRTGAAIGGNLGFDAPFGATGGQAYAQATVASLDTFTLRSSNLPLYSSVNVNLRYFLTGQQGSSASDFNINVYSRLSGYIYIHELDNASRPALFEQFCASTSACALENSAAESVFGINSNITFALLIGVTYAFESVITSESVATADLRGNADLMLFRAGATHLQAFNSLHTYLTPTSDDFSIDTESGHDYAFSATPVPEPRTYALMLAGLCAVGLSARRRESISR